MEQISERRQRRTHIRQLALQYQLERVVDDFDMRTFAVADQDGFLLASSGRMPFAEVLAAYAPTLSDNGAWQSDGVVSDLQSLEPELRWQDITVREFRASGHKLYLCAIGKVGTMKEVGIYRAILGIRRIFTN